MESNVSIQGHKPALCYLFGTGTTEITRKDLPEDDTILPQVIATAREPRLQKDPILL